MMMEDECEPTSADINNNNNNDKNKNNNKNKRRRVQGQDDHTSDGYPSATGTRRQAGKASAWADDDSDIQVVLSQQPDPDVASHGAGPTPKYTPPVEVAVLALAEASRGGAPHTDEGRKQPSLFQDTTTEAGRDADAHIFVSFELLPHKFQSTSSISPSKVQPVKVNALVDTGATRSVMSKALADRLDAQLSHWPGTLRSASGASMTPVGVASVQARPAGTELEPITLQLLVVDNLISSLVLGMDCLQSLGLELKLGIDQPAQVAVASGVRLQSSRGVAGRFADLIAALVQDAAADPEPPALMLDDSPDYREPGPSLEQLQAATQSPELLKIIEQFRDVFAADGRPPGTTSAVHHHIPTGDAAPIRRPPYRLGPERYRAARVEVEALLKRGLIVESASPWAAPIVLVPKPDKSIRLCMDYRLINRKTTRDSFPLPRIEDLFDKMSGARIFTTLDLASGYHQVPMAPEDRAKTAFTTPWGLFEWTVMPFGLSNAPATFQRLMQDVLRGMEDFVGVYIDDVVIFSRDFEQHVGHVERVFRRLKEVNLQLQFKKCKFGKESIKYLGHIVDANGVHTDPEKVAAMREMPSPNNVSELRSFLGMVNYYRRFVPNFATIAEPLNKLTRKNTPFIWSIECETAAQTIKNILAQAPVLSMPLPDTPFVIQTDASLVGIGAVLAQRLGTGSDGHERVLGYISRALDKAERNYSATERECLAVIWAISAFDHYVYGQHFIVETDHEPLKWLLAIPQPKGRLARWTTLLQQYTFEVAYRPGNANGNADALSRLPRDATPRATTTIESIAALSDAAPATTAAANANSEHFAAKQRRDPYLAPLIKFLESKVTPPEPSVARRVTACAPFYALDDHNRLVILPSKDAKQHRRASQRLVVPEALKPRVLADHHDDTTAAHQGQLRTLQRIAERFYWDGMVKEVKHYVDTCTSCQERKRFRNRGGKPGELQSIISTEPFATVAMDYMGPFPLSSQGHRYVLVTTDLFTKFCQFIPTVKADAATTAKHLVNDVIARFGAPKRILTDRGTHFTAEVVKTTATLLGSSPTFTTAYHPQTDGQAERLNQVFQSMVSMFVDEQQKTWDRFISLLAFAYNTTQHASTKETPFFLTFGRDPYTPSDVGLHVEAAPLAQWSTTEDYRAELVNALEDAHNAVRQALDRARRTQQLEYDARHTPTEYKPGEQVWLYVPRVARGASLKLARLWKGPFRIIEKLGPVTYRLAGRGNRRLHQVVNVARLKPFKERSARPGHTPDLPDDDAFDAEIDAEAMPQEPEPESQETRGPRIVERELLPASGFATSNPVSPFSLPRRPGLPSVSNPSSSASVVPPAQAVSDDMGPEDELAL